MSLPRKLTGAAFFFFGGLFGGTGLIAALVINLGYGSWLFLTGDEAKTDMATKVWEMEP